MVVGRQRAGGQLAAAALHFHDGRVGHVLRQGRPALRRQIKAYELWNEPGDDDKGTVTTAVYTTLLNETRPNIRKTGNDPNAKVIGFAGCPNLTSGVCERAGGAGQRHRGPDGRGQRAHLRPAHAA